MDADGNVCKLDLRMGVNIDLSPEKGFVRDLL
jgi:hypothetical protein